jgi:hypothetical protein
LKFLSLQKSRFLITEIIRSMLFSWNSSYMVGPPAHHYVHCCSWGIKLYWAPKRYLPQVEVKSSEKGFDSSWFIMLQLCWTLYVGEWTMSSIIKCELKLSSYSKIWNVAANLGQNLHDMCKILQDLLCVR